MPEQKNEVADFLKGIPSQDSPIADAIISQPTVPEKDKEEKIEAEPKKNRRHRRIEDAYQREREMNIALNERVKVLSELNGYSKEHAGEVDPRLVQLFGTEDTGKAATKLFADLLTDTKRQAEESAFQRLQKLQDEQRTEEVKNSKFIDEEFENLEEKYGVDFEADKKLKNDFIDLVEALSPKDEDGNIKDYADFETTFELFQKTQAPKGKSAEVARKQKDYAARSMTQSGQVNTERAPEGPMNFNRARRFIDTLGSN